MSPRILAAVGSVMLALGVLLAVLGGCSTDIPTLPTLYFVGDGGVD